MTTWPLSTTPVRERLMGVTVATLSTTLFKRG